MHDPHDVEQLPLVFMNALDLNVEQRIGIDRGRRRVGDQASEPLFVGAFDGAELLSKCGVGRERLERPEPLEIGDPPITDGRADESGQARIRLHQPAARRHAIRLVVESFRPERMEIGHQVRLNSRCAWPTRR